METKDLNLIPSGSMPIVHASQFDNMRHIRFNLKDDEEEYTLESGITLECHIKKVDGNVVTFSVENTETKYIDVYFPQQATACAGPNIGEIVITDEDNFIIGTINFILEVEKSPMLGGIESASDIHDLTEQIEVIVTQVIATDYYTKSEVDNLLNDKADISDLPDMDNYYDKSSVDTLLNGKVNRSDLNNYYNKTQVDNLLDDKADISDLPDMSNYYTKTQIDNKFLDIMPVNTVSGSVANFTTLIVAHLEGLKTYITAQGGGGTPSAPVAIVGWNSVNITCADEDMQTVDTFTLNLGQTIYGGYVDWENGKLVITHFLLGAQTWMKNISGYSTFYCTPSEVPKFISNTQFDYICSHYECMSVAATTSTGDNYIYVNNQNRITVKDTSCASMTEEEFAEHMAGVQFVYLLATPIEISLPTTMPQTIEGVQNWFADSGDIDISFKQDIQNYVDSKISAANVNRTLSMIRPVTTEESKGDEDER